MKVVYQITFVDKEEVKMYKLKLAYLKHELKWIPTKAFAGHEGRKCKNELKNTEWNII